MYRQYPSVAGSYMEYLEFWQLPGARSIDAVTWNNRYCGSYLEHLTLLQLPGEFYIVAVTWNI